MQLAGRAGHRDRTYARWRIWLAVAFAVAVGIVFLLPFVSSPQPEEELQTAPTSITLEALGIVRQHRHTGISSLCVDYISKEGKQPTLSQWNIRREERPRRRRGRERGDSCLKY